MAYTDDQLAVMEAIITRYPRKRSAILSSVAMVTVYYLLYLLASKVVLLRK